MYEESLRKSHAISGFPYIMLKKFYSEEILMDRSPLLSQALILEGYTPVPSETVDLVSSNVHRRAGALDQGPRVSS